MIGVLVSGRGTNLQALLDAGLPVAAVASNRADAPALADRSFRHRLKGRDYDLYYSGKHLHMVVLRQGDATYWVVNTLLDSLSNETMLAIAKGLKPLGPAK